MAVPVVIKLKVEGGKVVVSELSGLGEVGDRAFHQIQDGAKRASTELSKVGVSAGGLRSAMAGLGTIAASVFTVDMARRIIEVGDAYQSLRDRVALAAGGVEAGAEAQKKLFDIAQQTRQPLESVSDLFSKIGSTGREMGMSMEDQLQVITMVSQALAINKTDAGAASGALLQFGQMMGGARVQAQEFNSILDGMRPVAKAMADGLGVSVGALKDLIATGTLEPRRAIEAMLTQSSAMEAQFGSIGVTAGEVWTQIKNQLFDTTGSMMSTTGATSELIDGMQKLLDVVSDPEFKSSLDAIMGGFLELTSAVLDGVAKDIERIRSFVEIISSVPTAIGGMVQGFREAHPQIAGVLDSWIKQAGFMQAVMVRAAEQSSAAFDEAFGKQKQLSNFAGANGFRSAQDIGTENEFSRTAIAMQSTSSADRPKRIPSPFTPQPRDQGKADMLAGQAADRAAAASATALRAAQALFAKDETAINDMLKQIAVGVSDRAKFVSSSVDQMSSSATEEQISAMREYANAAFTAGEMAKYNADQEERKKQIQSQGLATTRDVATATEIYAQRMDELRAQLEAGAISQETYNRAARKASDDTVEAQRQASADVKKGLDSNVAQHRDAYAEIGRVVDQTYQGIAAGLAAMIVKGKADFSTFVEGMAQSLLQSGIQALMTSMIGGGTQGGGLVGMLMGGGTTTTASAHGNVFSGGNVVPFARGGIVDRPVIFPMARGAGLMGEAGPEAVMPLRRLPSGDLGVMSGGSGAPPQITIALVNESRTQLRAEQQTGPDGGLKVMLREIIGAEIGTPGTPGHMATRGVVQRYGNGR